MTLQIDQVSMCNPATELLMLVQLVVSNDIDANKKMFILFPYLDEVVY